MPPKRTTAPIDISADTREDVPDISNIPADEKKQDEKDALKNMEKASKRTGGEHEGEDDDDDLSDVNRALKMRLDELTQIIMNEKDAKLLRAALEALRTEIRASTSSMTSVPMPLKFMRPHYPALCVFFDTQLPASDNKKFLADILSVLAMTMGDLEARECLKYKLQGETTQLGDWGHEYVRNLSGEIGVEFNQRSQAGESVDDLSALVDDIVPFNMTHNSEIDACDLLMEVDQMSKLSPHITADQTPKLCRYLMTCSAYVADKEDRDTLLDIAYTAYRTHGFHADALRVAVQLGSSEKMSEIFADTADDELMRKQLAFILSVQRTVLPEFEDDDELMEAMGNVNLSTHFANLARDLDVQEAKTPEDIYKSHLAESGPGRQKKADASAAAPAPGVDSAKQNLASTFVNAFVNCGFGKDLLVTPDGSDWLYKNKDHGMLSATASLGMIMLWDVEEGFSAIDKYSFSQQAHIKAGAVLATGVLSSGVTSEMDAALALLSEHVESDDASLKTSAVFGLGLAYAGSAREDVLEILVPLIVDDSQTMEVVSLTCLALGLVFCGTGNDDISGSIIEAFLDRSDTDLRDSSARLMCLGLGLLFLGQSENADVALSAIAVIEHPIRTYVKMTLETCAYAGTGSVEQIQKYLRAITPATEAEATNTGEDGDDKKEEEDAAAKAAAAATTTGDEEKDEEAAERESEFKNMHQGVAVLGIALASMGDNISTDMSLRMLDHLLQFAELPVRRAVPLALGLLSVSHARLTVMDTLSKLAHDQDLEVSQNAVLGLGFLGAGTNHSRIAQILRQLAVYYAKEPNHLFLVRIAQGLLHMGKGLLTLIPFHSDNALMSNVSMAGLLTVFHAALDLKNTLLSKKHYLLFSLVTSIRPRMLVCLNEDLESIPVKVRVGLAMETVATAGKAKAISGFQTHTTPVLLSAGDRAELDSDKYIALTTVLEGFVIVKENPDYEEDVEMTSERKN